MPDLGQLMSGLSRRKYEQPPVVEALARFQWAQPMPWNVTTPGLLFERLRGEYPADPQTRSLMQADLSQQAAAGGPASSSFQMSSGPMQMVFANEEHCRLMIVGPQDISVHALAPYEGWEQLEARLFGGLELLGDLLPVDRQVATLGLRYINRVEIPSTPIRFDDYLTISFALPPTFPAEMVGFLDRVEVVYPDAPVRLAFTWASTDADEGTSAFVLDFDLVSALEEPLSLEAAREALADMKAKETSAFEGLLQDSLRKLFGEIQ